MANVNRNSALDALQGLVEQSFVKNQSYMPEGFNEKQQMALELFKQRIFLEEVIDENLSFNKKINFEATKGIYKVSSAEELVNVFKLRSDIYTKVNYQKECPDFIEGLNFDMFDKSSAILFTKVNNKISGTIKVIYDSDKKLPSEEKFSFNTLREKYKQIVELSRFVVNDTSKGLSQDFKYLFMGVYKLYMENDIDLILSCIREEHYKMYDKFGGVNVEKRLESYGFVKVPFLVLSWNPNEASEFFKKAFLGIR